LGGGGSDRQRGGRRLRFHRRAALFPADGMEHAPAGAGIALEGQIAGIPTAACALAATPDHARRIGYCPISNAETRLDPADHRVLVADFHRVSAVLRDVDSVHRKLEGPAPRIDPDLRRS